MSKMYGKELKSFRVQGLAWWRRVGNEGLEDRAILKSGFG